MKMKSIFDDIRKTLTPTAFPEWRKEEPFY
jgi:hypothetical protein